MMAALAVALMPASAQYKMQVELNNGYVTDFYVSEIKQIIWSYDNPGQGGGEEDEPTVTGDATDITNYTATITAWANNIRDNLSQDLEVGIIYTAEGTPSKSNGKRKTVLKSDIAEDGRYSVTLTGLSPSTTYYYRSYVYQSGLWFYGKVKSFTTEGQGVKFAASSVSNVTCFSAKVSSGFTISESTSYSSLSYGICYGNSPEPTTSDSKVTGGSRNSDGSYAVTLRALAGGTVYYYRPYAIIDGYVSYGHSSSFRTADDNVVETVGIDEETQIVTCRLTIGGGAYSTLALGVCWNNSSDGTEPTVDDRTATANEVDDENLYQVTIVPRTGQNNYRAYVLIDGIPHYGTTKSFDIKKVCEYVDLGLPSGTLWATCNVGADKPEDYGDYYAWGETEEKSYYDWSTYKYCKGDYNELTKYCSDSSYGYNGYTDNRTVLEPDDDVAHVKWGGDWRMPTDAEWSELRSSSNCTWTWYGRGNTEFGGTAGYKVTSRKSGYESNFIFLPAAGYRLDGSLGFVGSDGNYWSASLYESSPGSAWRVNFYSRNYGWYGIDRDLGLSVRPVCP